MRYAIYARTASLEQSTAAQIEKCREYIQGQKNWTITQIFDVPGASRLILEREGLHLLMKNATVHLFDCVVIAAVSRISRNSHEVIEFAHGLEQLGIKLISLDIANQSF